jgi:hypothetical protein
MKGILAVPSAVVRFGTAAGHRFHFVLNLSRNIPPV